jgi:phage-related protein
MKEFIAYEGKIFNVEWFFDEKGKSEALNFFETLSNSQKRKTLMLFKRIGDFGKISAFKPHPDRFLSFFYVGEKIVITNGFRKKAQKFPKQEKDSALKKMKDYDSRVRNGDYYEE